MSMQDLIRKAEAEAAARWQPPQALTTNTGTSAFMELSAAAGAARGVSSALVAKPQQPRRSVIPAPQVRQVTRSEAEAARQALPVVFPVKRGGYATPQGWQDESQVYSTHDVTRVSSGLARYPTALELEQHRAGVVNSPAPKTVVFEQQGAPRRQQVQQSAASTTARTLVSKASPSWQYNGVALVNEILARKAQQQPAQKSARPSAAPDRPSSIREIVRRSVGLK